MIEKNFDIPFISNLALREKQIQQNYRPVIAVHKWFARRPGTLFRGLLLSEFSDNPLRDAFYEANQFPGINIADPFMGGGTPLLEANRLGCNVVGFDINPMSFWIVKQEIDHLDLYDYRKTADSLRAKLEKEIGYFYRTRCIFCGSEDAQVKYFLWVKVKKCIKCKKDIDLFPGYLIATNSRHPKNVFICPSCGELVETDDRNNPGACGKCSAKLQINGPAKRGHCNCPHCGTDNIFPDAKLGPLPHRLFAIEYFCPICKPKHVGRFFKKPDSQDLNRINELEERWTRMRPRYVPDDEIPTGDETNRLLRWGYSRYRELFNSRQLLGLELSARLISKISNERVRNALATNLSDLLRYQNMLCRYDKKALKSLDIFSVHGFPVGLIQCESNFLGIIGPHKKVCVGSGGWANIIEKFRKAKAYCDNPFEVKHRGQKKEIIPIIGEWIGDHLNNADGKKERIVNISCKDAAVTKMSTDSLDAVLTDPPYYGNVQYAELMDFCYVWLRKLVGKTSKIFDIHSTRNPAELTGNKNMGRGLEHFTEGISSVFQKMSIGLKPGAPLVFTYHHNKIEAYYPIAVAILDAGLTCSVSLPCPAEMSASIHIRGTGSSIIDTVFVCRSKGKISRYQLVNSPIEAAQLVKNDLAYLKAGNVKLSPGDMRCITFGHLIRLAIWSLKHNWDKNDKISRRISKIADWMNNFGGWPSIKDYLMTDKPQFPSDQLLLNLRESRAKFGEEDDYISF